MDGSDGAISVTVSPDGKHLYVAGSAEDAVAVFSRDDNTGMLTFVEMLQDGQDGVDGLYGVSSVTVSPDGKHLYVTGALDDAIAAFGRDESTGMLTFVEMQRGVDGLGLAYSLIVSPDGKHLYVTGFTDHTVAVFNRDENTGILSFVEVYRDDQDGVEGIEGPMSITITPDGKHLYVAGHWDDAVAVFSRDEGTGMLLLRYTKMDRKG